MGNVSVKYREQRGIYEAGSEIQDPRDFFEDLISHQFNDVQALYQQQAPEVQHQINEVFNGAKVFASQSAAQMWFDEIGEEPEDLQRAKDALMPFLTQ